MFLKDLSKTKLYCILSMTPCLCLYYVFMVYLIEGSYDGIDVRLSILHQRQNIPTCVSHTH
jgi:hypothetical protein